MASELYENSDFAQAKRICSKVLKKKPDCPEILHCLGLIHFQEKDYDAAVILLQRAVALRQDPYWQRNLASACFKKGDLSRAENILWKILQTNQDFADAYHLLGEIYFRLGDDETAEKYYLHALMLEPDMMAAYLGLGLILTRRGYIQASIAAFQHMLKFRINDELRSYVLHALAASYLLQGRVKETLDCLANAMRLKEDFHQAHSAFLATLNYLYGFEGERVFANYLQFNLNHVLMLDNITTSHSNKADPHRKLKIGYVSPDFRNHALFNFIEPVFRNFSRREFSIYCYFNHTESDAGTEMLKASVANWIDSANLSDEDLAQRIIADQIDILVDLAGHTVGNRLLTFARKPAPIQITFAGYPCTSGLTAMDYRITDPQLDPPGMTEQIHTEQLLYLPSTAFFSPPGAAPEVNALPALESEYFTLGSFNQVYKVTDDVIAVWARVLKNIKNSRLYMVLGDAENELIRKEYREKFVALGAQSEQLIFFAKQAMDNYLQLHHEIDLCLDTFPYNGGTTTHYSLWMGVPVVTLAGNTPCSRVGVTILTAAGQLRCITASAEDYIDRCVYFSENLMQLATIRQSLRETVMQSSIRDEQGFVGELDSAYRRVWKKWCAQQTAAINSSGDE